MNSNSALKTFLRLLVGLGLVVLMSACSSNVTYEAPRDQLSDMCSGNFVNTPSACVNSRFIASGTLSGGYYSCKTFYRYPLFSYYGNPVTEQTSAINPSCVYVAPTNLGLENSNALILLSEAGDIYSNATNLIGLRSGYPAALYPYFRTLQNNTLSAFLAKLLESNGKRYGRIYLIRSDIESKSLLLQTIKRVTAAHTKVDMLLAIHGNPGNWALSPQLNVTLTSSELLTFAQNSLTPEQRNKVRAIFSTACFADSGGATQSMTSALAQAFPQSVNYGSRSVNWGPMHRDFTAFEAYYSGSPFSAAIATGNNTLQYNQANGVYRSRFFYPTLLVRGCADMGLWTDCRNETISLGSFGTDSIMLSGSAARLVAGAQGDLNVQIAPSLSCRHPDTGVLVAPKTVYSYYTYNMGYPSVPCESNYKRTATCRPDGTWYAPVPATRYPTCVDQPYDDNYSTGGA